MAPCMSAAIACSDLLADLGEVARLVDHAAALAAHAERAGLAGVLRAHRLPQLQNAAGLAGFAPGVQDGRPAAAGFVFLHRYDVHANAKTPSTARLVRLGSSKLKLAADSRRTADADIVAELLR